jgi:hypothetical protein
MMRLIEAFVRGRLSAGELHDKVVAAPDTEALFDGFVARTCWTEAQKAELLRTGEVKGYTGHHINNVASAPDWKGDAQHSFSAKWQGRHTK